MKISKLFALFGSAAIVVSTFPFHPPAYASSNMITPPTFSIDQDGMINRNTGTWANTYFVDSAVAGRAVVLACQNPVTTAESDKTGAEFSAMLLSQACTYLTASAPGPYVFPANVFTAFSDLSQSQYTTLFQTYPHVLYSEQARNSSDDEPTRKHAWTISIDTRLLSGAPSVISSAEEEVPPLVYYGGPKITGFSKPASIGSNFGGDVRLEGKRMFKVTSATIGGVAADFVSTRTSLQVTVPTGLQPGVYDLVLQTTSGRHTIIRFITISTIN